MPTNAPHIPLSRQAHYRVLTTVQNSPTYANRDIMTFAGMLSLAELIEHVWSNFLYLPAADKARALDTLRDLVAPVAA